MKKADLIAYRERWKLVEAVQYAELRAKSIEQRWRDLQTIISMADSLGLSADSMDDSASTDAVRARWVRLKSGLESSAVIYTIPSRPTRHRLREAPEDSSGLFGIGQLGAALAAIDRLFQHPGHLGIVIGGVAVSLLGKPRLTKDIDVMIPADLDALSALIQHAADAELIPRIDDVAVFARQSRVLLLVHAPSGIEVGLSLGVLPFEIEAVRRAKVHQIGDVCIRLPTPEDLIVFKAVAHRRKDLQDIYDIIQANPALNRARVRAKVRAFAKLLEMPELWEDIAAWLS